MWLRSRRTEACHSLDNADHEPSPCRRLTLLWAAGLTLVMAAVAIGVMPLTQACEPRFAGFCVALGWVLGGTGRWPDEGLPAFAALVGTTGALLLVWRYKVKPERAAQTTDRT